MDEKKFEVTISRQKIRDAMDSIGEDLTDDQVKRITDAQLEEIASKVMYRIDNDLDIIASEAEEVLENLLDEDPNQDSSEDTYVSTPRPPMSWDNLDKE
jgi:hypothetical protein